MNAQSLPLAALKFMLSAGVAKVVGHFYHRAGMPVFLVLIAYWLWSSWKYERWIHRHLRRPPHR